MVIVHPPFFSLFCMITSLFLFLTEIQNSEKRGRWTIKTFHLTGSYSPRFLPSLFQSFKVIPTYTHERNQTAQEQKEIFEAQR